MSPLLQRSARLGLVPGLCIAIGLVFGQSATAQYTSDFESPLYTGSAAGTIITGQDGFYIPVPDSQDGLVYTYTGNALGLPANPSGGGDQFAGVTGGDVGLPVPFARAQRDVVYGAGTGAWTVSFDIAATFIGALPSAQNVGSFSTQIFPGNSVFIALAMWTDPDTAATWDADYVWFDAADTQLTESVADPGFQNLAVNHWYRWSTTFNLDTNQIVQVSITDLTTNVTVTHNPEDRYLDGGAAGGNPPPSGFRLFGGSSGVAGNTLAFDNVDIDLASGTPLGACCFVDETCDFLTEADCLAADGLYSGDWIACTVNGCLPIPEACGKGAGACGEPNGTPGCEDELCCAQVCDLDPLCCILEWDQTCADIAIGIGCALLPCPVSFCDAGVCTLSQSQNSNIDAGNQVACGAGGNTTENGWARCYNLVAEGVPVGQNLTINSVTFGVQQATIDGINVDVILYIDCDGCPAGEPGVDATVLAAQSLVVNMSDVGNMITVNFPAGTVVPAGTDLIVEIANVDDGTVEPLFAFRTMSNAAGQCGPSYLRAAQCGFPGWTTMADIGFPDSHLIQSVSASVGGAVTVECAIPESCGKGAGPCNGPNGTPGCDDELCCALVCAQVPECCDVEWDQACADVAALNCPPAPCVLDTGGANYVEAEACGDDTNGGCNSDPPAFEPVSSGDIIHGTAWADGGTRDTDWYLLGDLASFDTDGNGQVDIHNNIVGELPMVSFIIVDALGDCSDISLVGTSTSQTCVQTNFNVTTVNTTDIIYIFAGTGQSDGGGIFDGYPCTVGAGTFGNNYLLCLTVVDDGDPVDPICPGGKPCPWDLDGGGFVGAGDLLLLLADWGNPYGAADLLALLADWGACP